MLTRLDHAILAVRDLAIASATFERIGFRVSPGGEHPGWGTHNSIVRFGLDYLELIAVRDEAEAAQSPFGSEVLRYLREGEGWIGYAVATDDAASEVEELRRRGVIVEGPRAGSRRRPDGSVLEWRTVGLGTPLSRRIVPFLIQHLPDDAERLRRFQREGALGGHPLGARRLRSVTIAVRDLAAAERLYGQELGLHPAAYEEHTGLRASVVWLQLGDDIVILAAPSSAASPLAAALDRAGEGLFAVEVEVEDLAAAARHIRAAGLTPEPTGPGRTVTLPGDPLHGARIALSQA